MRVRQFVVGAVVTLGAIAGLAAPAFAHDCANLSRPQGNAEPFSSKGRWTYIPESESEVPGGIWVLDNPAGFGGQSGHEDALLDGTGACNNARLTGQTGGGVDFSALKGIWSEDCVIQAASG